MITTTCSTLRNWLILTAAILGSGCLSPEEKCMKLGGGYGWADVTSIEADCRKYNGTDCDSTQFIELEEAKCIASNAGLDDGLDGLHGNLGFSGTYDTVTWVIFNFTSKNSGMATEIHATTGAILQENIIGDS